MKKAITLLIAVAMLVSVLALAACGNAESTETTATEKNETTTASATETTAETTTTATETTTAETTTATETTTAEPVKAEIPSSVSEPVSKDSIKILAIGNSFSMDSMEHLYGILKDMGANNIVLGDLYIGGCSLETHEMNIEFNVAAYDYYTNTSGTWSKRKASVETAIKQYDWDYISLQQVSGLSGKPETYEPYLTEILDLLKELIKENCPNAKLVWNMTWAYQGNSTHSDFPKYGNNQTTMYNAIVNTVKEAVLVHDEFELVIPVGTTIQNLRTSYIGDTITRDGYHLDMGFGRYAAALTWAKALTGWSIDDVTWSPNGYYVTEGMLKAIKESVNNAVKTPDKVTESEIKVKPDESAPENKEAEALLKATGRDPVNYTLVDLRLTYYAYYNSSANSTLQSKANSTASNLNQFAATRLFSKKEIPNGSVILLKSGYQYRPEGWSSLNTKNSSASRPANVTTEVVVVDNKWWGGFSYRAFNIAKKGNPALSEDEMTGLADAFYLFVPKDTDSKKYEGKSVDEIFELAGYDKSKYTKLDLDVTTYAYYNSTDSTKYGRMITKADNPTNINQFAATKVFAKADIPVGSVIVLESGYQYRPEAWTAMNAKTSGRPTNVDENVIVVDAAWWASWNFRAFNIAKSGNPALSEAEMNGLKDVLAIYVPND